jgi:hypothetical protein
MEGIEATGVEERQLMATPKARVDKKKRKADGEGSGTPRVSPNPAVTKHWALEKLESKFGMERSWKAYQIYGSLQAPARELQALLPSLLFSVYSAKGASSKFLEKYEITSMAAMIDFWIHVLGVNPRGMRALTTGSRHNKAYHVVLEERTKEELTREVKRLLPGLVKVSKGLGFEIKVPDRIDLGEVL